VGVGPTSARLKVVSSWMAGVSTAAATDGGVAVELWLIMGEDEQPTMPAKLTMQKTIALSRLRFGLIPRQPLQDDGSWWATLDSNQ
jgi:hypothetical protein